MRCAPRLLLGMLLLGGAASAVADLVPSPGQVDFMYQHVNTTSEPLPTTLRNTGNQALTIEAVTPATGVYARVGGTCGAPPFTIAAQSSCTLEHTFTPSAVMAFPQTQTVTLAGGSTVAFGLYGRGEVGYLDISPSTLYYFTTPVGTIGAERTAVMNNVRPVPMRVTQMGLLGAQSDAFVRTGGTCPTPPFEIGASGGCQVTYTFVPHDVGPASATLYITASSGSFALFFSGDGGPEISLFKSGFEAAAFAPIP